MSTALPLSQHAKRCGHPAQNDPSPAQRRWARRLYRTAFLAGSTGATVGALAWTAGLCALAFQPALAGRLFAPLAWHFHSRVFFTGFFALFMLGFGYQAFPRFKGRLLPHPPPALLGMALVVLAVALNLGGLLGVMMGVAVPGWLAPLAAVLAALGVMPYPWQVAVILRGRQTPEDFAPYDVLLMTGALGLFAAAALDALSLLGVLPPRLHGPWVWWCVAPLTLGVCQRFAGGVLGVGPIAPWRNTVAAGLVVLAGGLWLVGQTMGETVAFTGPLAALLLGAAVLTGAHRWLLRKGPPGDVSAPFFRAQAVWLFVAQTLALGAWAVGWGLENWRVAAVALNEHGLLLGVGAVAIVGTSLRVTPALTSRKPAALPAVGRWAWMVVNLAVLLRLSAPMLSALGLASTHPLAASGLLLSLALIPWWVVVGEMLLRPDYPDQRPQLTQAAQASLPLEEQTVAQVLTTHPHALDILVGAGFTPLKNPAVRAAMAGTITLRGAAERRGLHLPSLVKAVQTNTPYEPPRPTGGAVNPDMSLLDIAAVKGEAAARLYSRHGLDACCGGGKTLRQAATAHGLDLETLLRELEAGY